MAPTPSLAARSGNSGTYSSEIADTLRFEEEIQSLGASTAAPPVFNSPPASGSSFTALLGLPPSRAVELLDRELPPPPSSVSAVGDIWRFPLTCSPIFPSNPTLVERASRFSVFAAEDSTEAGSISGDHAMKVEPAYSVELPDFQIPVERPQQKRSTGKRNNSESSKAKCPGKKGTSGVEDNCTGGDDKLPYLHFRARRGQATDSHSLAERARREKINARMKLLQDLVPGCDKISGTALVLDEIINHVQSLQRQVEFLSMRLSAVNPRIDFSSVDSILSAECGRLMSGDGNGTVGPEQTAWSVEGTSNEDRQMWHGDLVQQQWERDEQTQSHHQQHVFIGQPGTSLFTSYDSTGSVSLPNQLKTEL